MTPEGARKLAHRMWHRLQHRLGRNTGRVETWWENGLLMTAFRCSGCGQRAHIHIAILPGLGYPREEVRQ